MDPQRLGSPTASFDLHFAKEHLQFSQAYRQRGQMRISLAGKDCYLTVGCKGGGVAPELAQVVVKQLDPRWVVQGVTSALLHTAGYTDVTVEEEHAGGLPSHLSVHSSYLGRSVVVAMVRAPGLSGIFVSISWHGVETFLVTKQKKKHASWCRQHAGG